MVTRTRRRGTTTHDRSAYAYHLVGLLLATSCSSSLFLVAVDAARVVVPSFRLVPSTTTAESFGQVSASTTSFDCTTDVADLISATVDECLKRSTDCLMSALFGSGQQCATSLYGGDDSVILLPGFLDVASVGTTGVIDSTNIETECIKPTLESSQCLALMQERLSGRANLLRMEYISLPSSATSQPPEETPPPVKIPLSTPAPVTQTQAPITSAPSTWNPTSSPTSIPTSNPTAAPVTNLIEPVVSLPTDSPVATTAAPVFTDAPSTSSPTVSSTSAPTIQLVVEAAVTEAPTTVPADTNRTDDDEENGGDNNTTGTEEDTDAVDTPTGKPDEQNKDQENGDPNTNPSQNIPYGQDAKSQNLDDDNTLVIVGAAIGAAILLCVLLSLGACRKRTRSNAATSATSVVARQDNETTPLPPPQEIDIEKGRSMDDTEGDTSESSNHQRQKEVDGDDDLDVEKQAGESQHSLHQPYCYDLQVVREDGLDVPENDEIMSTGSSSFAFSLESDASSSLYSGHTGVTSGNDTTDLDFDGDTIKSIRSSDLIPRSSDNNNQNNNNNNYITHASDSSSVASESSIESDDPDQRAAQQIQPSAWLTRSDRLVTAAQRAAAAVEIPATSQADF